MSLAVQIAAILLAVPVVGLACVLLVRFVRRLHDVHEAIIGRPEGPANEAVPSMIERFHAVEDHLTAQDDRLEGIEGYLGTDKASPFRPVKVRAQ